MTAYYRTMQTASDEAVKMIQATNGETVSIIEATNATKSGVIATKAMTVATAALNAVMSAAIYMAIAAAIAYAVKAIDDYIHRSERMIEAGKEAQQTIKSLSDEIHNNAKAVEDLTKKYEELAKGVDAISGKNISLSDEEYNEFVDGENGNLLTTLQNIAQVDLSALSTTATTLSDALTNMSNVMTTEGGFSSLASLNFETTVEQLGTIVSSLDAISSAIGGEDGLTGGLLAAFQSLNSITFGAEGSGLIGEFEKLQTAISDTTSAINGGGESSGNGNESKKSGGKKEGNTEGGGDSDGTLVSALQDFQTTGEAATTAVIGEGDGEEGSGFTGVDAKVIKTTTDIGTPADDGSSETLDGAINGLGTLADTVMHEVNNQFKELAEHLKDARKEAEKLVAVLGGTAGGGLAEGTANFRQSVGYASGTAYASGDWSAKRKGVNGTALVGELGKELVVDPHTGRWHTVGDNGAEFAKIPGDSIVFNHRQTEEIFKYGHINSRGKAYANGNNASSLLPDITDDMLAQLQKQTITEVKMSNSFLQNISSQIQNGINKITSSMVKNTNNNITVYQTATITCPNVTDNSGAEYIVQQLSNLSQRAYQTALSR